MVKKVKKRKKKNREVEKRGEGKEIGREANRCVEKRREGYISEP